MWPRWGRVSSSVVASSSPAAAATNQSFSFKDLRSLLNDDDDDRHPSLSNVLIRSSAVFHRLRVASGALRAWRSLPSSPAAGAGTEEEKRIVVYYTSLRVVRKTFEDCRAVRSILRGFRVALDERDLSMDSGFLAELKQILGKKQLALPRVFVGGRYVGGFDEIQQLHETGELKNLIAGVPAATAGVCDVCGGVRFLLCHTCSGSHKYFSEKSGFRTCNACNENGLVRCPDCCCGA